MSELVRALGLQAACRLAEVFGGRTIRVPTMPTSPRAKPSASTARLAAIVGPTLAADLITAFGGCRLYIAKGTPYATRTTPISVARVTSMTDAGMTADQIADALGCTPRTVYSKRATHRSTRRTDA